jgi:glycosyltransferase involved in cell wall biosynthesis
MYPQVSVIIPCYNQGHYLLEALTSVQRISTDLIETIVINDGSTDQFTIDLFRKLQAESKHRIIHQKNKGLPGARNAGIREARAKYVLPFDCDNRIQEEFVVKAIKILDENPNTAVVYSSANLFGEQTGISVPGPFNLQRLMINNYIDACAVIRKSTLISVAGYDEKMRIGWEDWDLWLRIAFAGYNFHFLDEALFDYRVTSKSMSRTLYDNYEKPNKLENYVHDKYPDKMGHQWIVNHYVKRFKNNPVLFVSKLFLKAYFPGYYNKLLLKNRIRNGL